MIGGPYSLDEPFEFDLDYFCLTLPSADTSANTSTSTADELAQGQGHRQGHGHGTDRTEMHIISSSSSASARKAETDLHAFSSEESRRGSMDTLEVDTGAGTGAVDRVGSLQSLKLAEEEEGHAASLRLTETSVVAEFERTGLRNRDGERDRERERDTVATTVSADSPRGSSVIVLDERDREASPVKVKSSFFVRMLSSATASMAFREAQERERDRSREGGPSYVPSPSVLVMAGVPLTLHCTVLPVLDMQLCVVFSMQMASHVSF